MRGENVQCKIMSNFLNEAATMAKRINLGAAKQASFKEVGTLKIFEGKMGYTIQDSKNAVSKFCVENKCKAILDCNWFHWLFDETGQFVELGDPKEDMMTFSLFLE